VVRAAIKAAVDAGRFELAARLLDVLREAPKPGAARSPRSSGCTSTWWCVCLGSFGPKAGSPRPDARVLEPYTVHAP
jgi:hypothetical protein